MPQTTNNFHRLVVENIPLIDVRAPVEFAAGAFPTAVNLPLMNDEERRLVGICYKEQGQTAAIALGHKLVCGPIKEERIAAWATFVQQHPDALIYCFRGGLRSQLSQEWAEQAVGRDIPRLEGGYKAFRTYLMEQLDPQLISSTPIIVGGRTGSGKTLLIRDLKNVVDLEAIANHRGSSFGRQISAQPTQIDFENRLAWALIQHREAGHRYMILEDEGRHVGRLYLPRPLSAHFEQADVVHLEISLDERVQITFDEYVTAAQSAFTDEFGEAGLFQWLEDLQGSLQRIRKRLGGERLKRVGESMQSAFDHHQSTGDPSFHKQWVELLLREYYDPMYDYQLEQKQQKIVFAGNAQAVREYLMNLEEVK
ncbi:MAG: tRNA 2-selenouridine(34) synthase MnmH [Kiritimatiellaeota bacterium]|nr:tRNA 2-selenouridine(34) synthase MnmH [Kiritimatiellota bacterium]